MQEKPNPPRDHQRESRLTGEEDEAFERATLTLVLALHPTRLTAADLARELGNDPEDFAQLDAVKRAVRDLAAVGLLHQDGTFVSPTRATLHFDRLARA